MTVFGFQAKHTKRISGKNLSWRRPLTGPHFEYEIQFHNVGIKITLIVTLQPANQKKESTSRCQGLFPPFPFSYGKSPGNEVASDRELKHYVYGKRQTVGSYVSQTRENYVFQLASIS